MSKLGYTSPKFKPPLNIVQVVGDVLLYHQMDGPFDRNSLKEQILSDSSQRNYKGELLELVQGWGEAMPRYVVQQESGPDHKKTFEVEVHILGKVAGKGSGNSKKEAEQHAAAKAISGARKLYGR